MVTVVEPAAKSLIFFVCQMKRVGIRILKLMNLFLAQTQEPVLRTFAKLWEQPMKGPRDLHCTADMRTKAAGSWPGAGPERAGRSFGKAGVLLKATSDWHRLCCSCEGHVPALALLF